MTVRGLIGAAAAALLLASCGAQTGDYAELASPDGRLSIVSQTISGGGAAGYISSVWKLRPAGTTGTDIAVNSRIRAIDASGRWIDGETLQLCVNAELTSPAVTQVLIETPSGPVNVRILYRCDPKTPGAPL